MSELTDREDAVRGLRAAADLIETMPFLPRWYIEVQAFNVTAEQMAEAARVPGGWEKGESATKDYLTLTRDVGVLVELWAARQMVCEAVPTGRKVTERRIATPAVYEDVEVDEVEWKCRPLLANETAEASDQPEAEPVSVSADSEPF